MKQLFLADCEDCPEDVIRRRLSENWSGDYNGNGPYDEDVAKYREELDKWDILIAYESVGDYGCDSAGWYLLKHKHYGVYGLIMGSHCSCYGFEGQGEIEVVDVLYLKNPDLHIILGGYDNSSRENEEAIKAYLQDLPNPGLENVEDVL